MGLFDALLGKARGNSMLRYAEVLGILRMVKLLILLCSLISMMMQHQKALTQIFVANDHMALTTMDVILMLNLS